MSLPQKVSDFIQAAKVLSYATAAERQPHCALCYYSFIAKEDAYYLLFKSSEDTQHIKEALINPLVAGSILPNRKVEVGSNQGIQFKGQFVLNDEKRSALKKAYYNKFPFAKAVPGEVWAIELKQIKMTDNTLGFGKKIHWADKS